MKFIADEGIDKSLVLLLRNAGHDVFYFAESEQSTIDPIVLSIANQEKRILITRDKDFGELVYRNKMIHAGIILSRLENLKSKARCEIIASFIFQNLDKLENAYIVIQPGAVRIRKLNESEN